MIFGGFVTFRQISRSIIEQGEKAHELWVLGFGSAGQFLWLSLHYGIQIKPDFLVLKTLHGLTVASLWTVPRIQQELAFFPSFHTFSPLTLQNLFFCLSLPYTCFVIHQSTHTNRTQRQQQKANSYSHRISLLHLIFSSISLPFCYCFLFALGSLLMPWL